MGLARSANEAVVSLCSRPQTATKSIKVVGAGFGRTGTSTMQKALQTLGFSGVYHMTQASKPIRATNFVCDLLLDSWHSHRVVCLISMWMMKVSGTTARAWATPYGNPPLQQLLASYEVRLSFATRDCNTTQRNVHSVHFTD